MMCIAHIEIKTFGSRTPRTSRQFMRSFSISQDELTAFSTGAGPPVPSNRLQRDGLAAGAPAWRFGRRSTPPAALAAAFTPQVTAAGVPPNKLPDRRPAS